MAAKVEHSLTHYDNVFFYIDISLRTTLKLRANGRNNFQQCWTMLLAVGQQSYILFQGVKWYIYGLKYWLFVLHSQSETKTAMSTSKRDEQPCHFHMGVLSPSKEQDWDDEHSCLMGYYNKIPDNI